MATELQDKKGSQYEDDWQKRSAGLDDLEEQFAAPAATDNDLPDSHPDKGPLEREDLQEREEHVEDTGADGGMTTATSKTGEEDSIPYREENSRFRRLLGLQPKGKKQRSRRSTLARRAAIGGGLGMFAVILMILIFLSSLKAVHFGEILSASGYARFRGVLVERTTQDLFDASVVRGEGEATLRGRSIIDRIKLRNVEDQLAEMGRQDKFRMTFKDGSLDSVKIGDSTVSLDQLTRQDGFGESFADIRGGFFGRLNPDNIRKVARVRQQFYEQLGDAANQTAGFDKRFIRNKAFGDIADNVGFKWSKWRNAARDFLGKTPGEALVDEKVNNVDNVSGANDISATGIDSLDLNQKAIKNAENLKKYLEKNGGQFDAAAYEQSVQADIGTSAKISEIASDTSMAVLILSLACMANQAFSRIPDIAKKSEDAAVRQGLQVLTASDQTKLGKTTAQAEGAWSTVLNRADTTSAYAYETGQEVRSATDVPSVKPKIDPTLVSLIQKLTSPSTYATVGLGPLGSVVTGIPGFDKLTSSVDSAFCGAILSPEGAITVGAADVVAQAIAAFFSAGGSEVAEQGAGRAAASIMLRELASSFWATSKGLVSAKGLGTLAAVGLYSVGLELVVDSLAGTSFFGAEQGPANYERAAVGTNIVQSRQMRSLYGRPLSKEEAQAVDSQSHQKTVENWQKRGVMTRYFGRDNPYSLVGLMAAKTPSSFASVGTMLSSFVTHVGDIFQPSTLKHAFSGVFASISGNRAYAATDPDFDPYYGNTQWGYSADELDKMRNDPTFSIAHLDEYLNDAQIQHFDSTIGKCFDQNLTQYEVENGTDGDKSYANDCTREKLSGDDVLRYRLYKGLDNYIADDFSQDYKAILAGSP